MKFLLSWVKEFIEISVPPEKLAERLTLGGLEVNRLEKVEGDWLFEAEVTPNRPDLLSHLGIARETAAVLGRPFRFPRWLSREFRPLRGDRGTPFPVSIEDEQGCGRYAGIVIEGVQIRPSPPALAKRLEKIGLRPINNVVDVTNLCMLELGQPLHAFDLDALEGGQIRVRRAKAGETLQLLDGSKCALSPDQLVIADGKKPAALAGVMGGQASQVTPQTKRILLEAAWFKPSLIRRSGRLAKISTDSSYRFERGIDPEMTAPAAFRAARWIARLSGGTVQTPITEVGNVQADRRAISLKPKKVQEVIGVRISSGQQRRILEHAGCKVRASGRGWRVEPPSWRQDLKIPEDLHEELVRLFGYDRVPATLPPLPRRQPAKPLEDPAVEREMEVRRLLIAAGMQEISSYSLIDPADHVKAKTAAAGEVELRNPLSGEQAVMRNTLLIGALQAVARNLNRKTEEGFRLFEVGSIFTKNPDGTPKETKALGMLAGGTPVPAWGVSKQPLGVFHLKGALELLSERLGVPLSAFSPEQVRPVDLEVAAAYEIPAHVPLAYAELDLGAVLAQHAGPVRIKPLAKISPAQRDLAIVVSDQVFYEQLDAAIREEGDPLLWELSLFDLYQGKQVPSGKKSLAFRLKYSAGDRTLTEEEIQAAHQKILDRLQKQFGATLRA